MNKRIEVSEHHDKKFIYFDLSNMRGNSEIINFIEAAKRKISEFPKDGSLLSMCNIEGIVFDTDTKQIVAEWLDYNKLYIKASCIIGADGIKKMVFNSVLKLVRRNIKFFDTLETAVDWLLVQ